MTKCIDCQKHTLMPIIGESGPLICELVCWGYGRPVVRFVARGQTPELNTIEAPDWCPLTKKEPA